MKNDIRDLSIDKLEEWLTNAGEPKYRAGQIFQWLYKKRAGDFGEMTNLSSGTIKKLEDSFIIYTPKIIKKEVSKIDNTIKYLLGLMDSELIETVLIKADKRQTLCLSTQVGCRYRCKFCASGLYGFKRNLYQSEILSQLITAQNDGCKITNIVFMGIGEPLDNFNNVIGAIKIINDKNGFNVGARKITISTAGVTDKIRELSNIGKEIELSVSLHAPDNKKRDQLMCINRIYPLSPLLKELKEYYDKTKRIITFEYILIKGINDTPEDAAKLSALLKDIKCKVNLIPLSPVAELPYQTPDKKSIINFNNCLNRAGVPATIRFSKGVDISAACGQLRVKSTKSNNVYF